MIDGVSTGTLATAFDMGDFALALTTELKDSRKTFKREQCRLYVLKNYTLARQAGEYTRLYADVLNKSRLSISRA